MQQVDAQNGGQWIRKAPSTAVVGVVGGSSSRNVCQGTTASISARNFSRLAASLDRGNAIAREAEPVATHQLSPGLRSRHHRLATDQGTPEPA